MMANRQVFVDELVAEGDRVCCRLTVTARLAAHGNVSVGLNGFCLCRISDGRLAASWSSLSETRRQRRIDAAREQRQ
jgi:hypothetical protein